jgi:hypothetical protein
LVLAVDVLFMLAEGAPLEVVAPHDSTFVLATFFLIIGLGIFIYALWAGRKPNHTNTEKS